MIDDTPLAALRAEHARLAAALAAPQTPAERAALRQAIVALFREAEQQIAELAAFKESIRELVDSFKALPEDPPPTPAVSVRHDHLGASTYLERAWTACAAGQWAAAESLLHEAIARDATSATARALLGWTLFHQRRADEALQLCLQVLLREPEHGFARTTVGAICLEKGILGEAIEHLTRVVRSAGDARATLYANYWLGVAYLEREMARDAVEFLRRAVTLGPNLAEGWAGLGQALWWDGQRAEAIEAWTVGARIKHSPHAGRSQALLDAVHAGGEPPRSMLR